MLLLCVMHASSGSAEATGAAAVSPLIVFAPEFVARASPSTSTEGNATLEAIRSDPAASHMRTGRSAPAAIAATLDTRVLSVVVPASADGPEAVLTFTGVDVEHDAESLVSLYARDEATDSEVALVIQGADVLGSIRRGDETWKVHPLGDGATAVYRYDTSRLRRHPPNRGEFMRKNMRMQRRAPLRDAAEAAADTGDVIDVLVAYTPAARREAGNIDAFIQFAIDNAHRAYRNSNIGLRLRLAHKHQVRHFQVPDMGLDLTFLTEPDDGVMDEVHTLRDDYGADLVALLVGRETHGVCGIARLPDFARYPDKLHPRQPRRPSPWSPQRPAAVGRASCASSTTPTAPVRSASAPSTIPVGASAPFPCSWRRRRSCISTPRTWKRETRRKDCRLNER